MQDEFRLIASIAIFFQKIPLHLGEIFKHNSGGEFGRNSSKTSFRAMYQFSSGKVTNFSIFKSFRKIAPASSKRFFKKC